MKKEDTKRECVLFTYSTQHLTSSDKVRFHYSLKGRNSQKGLLKEVAGKHLGSTVLLIPKEHEAHVIEYFTVWKIPFEKHSIRLMKHMEGFNEQN